MVISPLANLQEKVLIGNDAGYLLAFYREEAGELTPVFEIGRDDYYAEIRASLPSNLEGGVYSFVIEGMTDQHYADIPRTTPQGYGVVRLYLYWRDTNASVAGYVANLAGLTDVVGNVKEQSLAPEFKIAELRIVGISRKAGSRRYETTITARERVFDILDRERLCAPLEAANAIEAATGLAEDHHLSVDSYPLGPPDQAQQPPNPGTEERRLEQGRTLLETMRELGRRMEEQTNKHGRGMYLIREGRLHVGPRTIKGAGEALPLTLRAGLVQVEALEPVVTDPNHDYCAIPIAPTRAQFKLTLKGRPDVKPGDVVKFKPAAEDEATTTSMFGALGALAGSVTKTNIIPSLGPDELQDPVTLLYVATVEHKLGRTSGFVTTVTGVRIADAESAWDAHTPAPQSEESQPSTPASPEQRAVEGVRRIATAQQPRRFPAVGEVRQMTTSGASEPPGQTLTIWAGLAAPDGRERQGNRLAIARPSPLPAPGVPYLSPFAWGKCGLVLPRYPGARVFVDYRNGQRDDPFDIGAVWEAGHGPDSEAGDWWLILPVDVPANKRASLPDNATPEEHTGKVTQDLIDAAGDRVIEVGKLTVRVGKDSLKDAGQRPAAGATDVGVTIEHADGDARIQIKNDGTIVIEAAKNLELTAPSGDITLNAQNVKVQVTGSMDVS